MSGMCALAGFGYIAQVRRCGLVLWVMQVGGWVGGGDTCGCVWFGTAGLAVG